jgi:hypothetical protein
MKQRCDQQEIDRNLQQFDAWYKKLHCDDIYPHQDADRNSYLNYIHYDSTMISSV